MEKEILEKNKQWLKKLYLEWIEYFDSSDYDQDNFRDENDLIAFIEDLEKHEKGFEDEIKTMKMYLRKTKRED